MDGLQLWHVFIIIVVVILAADLWCDHKPHHIPLRTALAQTVVWVSVALVFGILIFLVTSDVEKTMEYYTAYAIEETMSMDNLFVFIIIFAYLGIKDEYQHKALFYGVMGAIFFRAVFIFVGVELLERFEWLLYIFGIVLLIVAIKTPFGKDEDEKRNKIAHYMKNRFNYVDDVDTEGRFFMKVNGKRVITDLFLCIIVIELTDIVFALDSIPAVLAISTDTLVIYTSNIFAIMGLRSLFFVIHGGMTHIRYLKYGLGIILLFVSVKLLFLHDLPIVWSLVIIIGMLLITIAVSLLRNRMNAGRAGARGL